MTARTGQHHILYENGMLRSRNQVCIFAFCCRGELLHYDRHRGLYHILYEDGEDEALRIGGETVRWLGPAVSAPCAAGLTAGANP